MTGGGLLVVPAAPALKDLEVKASYREALMNADMAIADSAYMVLVWNWLQHDSIRRLSGLEYLRELLKQPDVRQSGNVLWIMASQASAERNLAWLAEQGIDGAGGLRVPGADVYRPGDLRPRAAGADRANPAAACDPDPGGWYAGTGGTLPQAKLELSACNSLYWSGYRVLKRRPGADPDVGGSKLSGVALSIDLGAGAVCSALLECAEVIVFVDSLSRTLASTTGLGPI